MPIYILWNYEKGGKKHAGKHETADEGYAVYLGRAEAILDSRTKKRETEEIARLLEDMQASAMAIGTAIEQVEGDGTQTVKLLEETANCSGSIWWRRI